jgi:hypothetical protein
MLIFRRFKLYFTASGMSLSVSGLALHGRSQSDIPDAVKYNLDLLKMNILLLETCLGI